MNFTEVTGIILSSAILSTIIGSLFGLFSNRKKDYIENITKERKEWRTYLRRFVADLNKCATIKDTERCIQSLKVRLNPYGMITDNLLDDSFLWEYIERIDYGNTESAYLTQTKATLTSLISCLLKFDWERSKEEVKGSSEIRLLVMAILISFSLYSVKHFLSGFSISSYHDFCVLFAFSTFINVLVMGRANKWRKKADLISCMLVVSLVAILFFGLYLSYIRPLSSNSILDWFIIVNPYGAFAYSFLIRIIRYRNNVGRMAKTVLRITANDKIPAKWSIFIRDSSKS